MALTTTQVNTAFLAALARPAEGSAATWGSTSLSLDALLDSIFIAENTEDFVESLYTELLGRASDAEGKAFWNSLLATTSKEAVLAQFKAAILAAGQADPSNADYQGLIATNKAFVQALYTNLLGREADAEGLDFWANALTSGTSRGDLLAQFTAAAMASGADNDDYQAITAKLAVADAFSAKFSAFNADVTADEKKAALDALKAMMEGVVAGSTVEDVQEEINQIAGNYQNRTSQVFTKANDDDLDASESTAATTFRGTVNLIDPAKGTIQDTDKVTGNTDFDDTLVVNVTSDSTHKLLDLDGNYLPTGISDIEKLIVNNGSANVSGTLNGVNFGKSVSITGTGDVNLNVTGGLENLSVSSATKGDVAIAVNSALGSYTGGNAGESVTVDLGGSITKASLGAGDDTLVINGAVTAGGAIDLGAGNDELVINSDIRVAANEDKITLDGGAGSKDLLTLNGALNLTGVKSIKGFETIDAKPAAGVNATISSEAANGLKAKLTDGSALTVNASTGTTAINLSGLSVDKNESATVSLQGLTQETITLSKTVTENIDISNAAAKNITIKGFVNGSDKLAVAQGAVVSTATATKGADLSKAGQVLDLLNKAGLSAGTSYVAINTSNEKASYVWKVTKTDGVALTRDDITLVANVDKALTANDFTGGSQPTPTPTPSEPTGLKYNETYSSLEVTQKISGDTVVGVDETAKDKVATATAIVINASGANISFDKKALAAGTATITKVTVQSDANTINTLDLTNLSGATKGAITTIADTAGNANFTLNEQFAALTTVNLGSGNDTLTLGENFSGSGNGVAVNAGDGDDTINISAIDKAKLAGTVVFDGGSGTDTVILNAIDYSTGTATQFKNIDVITGTTDAKTKITSTISLGEDIANKTGNAYTLNDIEINGDLVLKAVSTTTDIDASALTDADSNANVTIDLSDTTAGSVASVKGSTTVKETILVDASFNNLTTAASVAGIDAIKGSASAAEVKVALFGADSTVKEIGGTLTIDTTDAQEAINLSALKALNGEKTTLTTKAVAKDITLSTDTNIKDVVQLASTVAPTAKVVIKGAGAGDAIDFSVLASSASFENHAAKVSSPTTIDNAKNYYFKAGVAGSKTADTLEYSDLFENEGTSSKTAYAAVQFTDSVGIYKITDDTQSSDAKIELIGTIEGVSQALGDAKQLAIF